MSKQTGDQASYDLESVKLPVLSGFLLRFLVWLTESPFNGLIQPSLLGKAGITRFRKRHFDELPTFFPVYAAGNRTTPGPARIDSIPASSPHQVKGFRFNSITDYNRAYRRGDTTPLDIAERLLKAAADSESLHIFVALNRDDVLQQAAESTQRYKNGKPLSILDGVPITVKDQFTVNGYPTTIGSRFLGKTPASADCTPVSLLRKTGAVLAGKTNMHELGLGVTGLNPNHGTPRNPYNTFYHTGGSSSGPAAAVAAGFGPGSLAADGGGSIRVPAGFCGLVGLKPTFGRVSLFGDSQLCWSVEHVGPIAATAEDAAILYAAMSGVDPNDELTMLQPSVDLDGWNRGNIQGLKIGIYPQYFFHADAETVTICRTLLQKLEDLGAVVREITIPDLEAGRVAHTLTIASEISQSLERYRAEHRKDYGLETRLNLGMARSFTAHDFLQAQRVRTRMITSYNRILEDVDLIVTPTTAIPAPLISEKSLPEGASDLSSLFEIMRFVTPANMTGLPAISFPAGYTKNGLPVGMHATARAWDEKTLLRLALATEAIVERREPRVYYDLLK